MSNKIKSHAKSPEIIEISGDFAFLFSTCLSGKNRFLMAVRHLMDPILFIAQIGTEQIQKYNQ